MRPAATRPGRHPIIVRPRRTRDTGATRRTCSSARVRDHSNGRTWDPDVIGLPARRRHRVIQCAAARSEQCGRHGGVPRPPALWQGSEWSVERGARGVRSIAAKQRLSITPGPARRSGDQLAGRSRCRSTSRRRHPAVERGHIALRDDRLQHLALPDQTTAGSRTEIPIDEFVPHERLDQMAAAEERDLREVLTLEHRDALSDVSLGS